MDNENQRTSRYPTNGKVRHLHTHLQSRLEGRSSSFDGYEIHQITRANPVALKARVKSGIRFLLPEEKGPIGKLMGAVKTAPEKLTRRLAFATIERSLSLKDKPTWHRIVEQGDIAIEAIEALYDNGHLSISTDFYVDLRCPKTLSLALSSPLNPPPLIVLLVKTRHNHTLTGEDYCPSNLNYKLPQLCPGLRQRGFALLPSLDFPDLDLLPRSDQLRDIPPRPLTDLEILFGGKPPSCEFRLNEPIGDNRKFTNNSPYMRAKEGFTPRDDSVYPEYRLRLFLLLFPELITLVEAWIAVKIALNKAIVVALEDGRQRDAEAAVRDFMAEMSEGGKHYEMLSKIAFFIDLIHFVNLARAPSVDSGIYKYLYGKPSNQINK